MAGWLERIEEAAARAARELAETRAGSPERAAAEAASETIARLRAQKEPPAIDPGRVQRLLEQLVVGLEGPRRLLLERMALRARTGGIERGPALLLAGPAGSGKTALLQALAAATDRPLVSIDTAGLGEADLLGTPRAAGGTQPGRLAAVLAEEGWAGPVLVLEGVDRAPGAAGAVEALLRARAFEDRFLRATIDLRLAIVVATARHPADVPERIRPCVEAVGVPGYTVQEKIAILSRGRPDPKADLHGFERVLVTDDAIERIATEYSPEPGVTMASRALGHAVHRAAARIALGEAAAVRISAPDLDGLLGAPPAPPLPRRRGEVGVAAAVVWGREGAEVAVVEALRDRHGAISKVGTMGGAAEAALAYIHGRAEHLRIEPGTISGRDVLLRMTGPEPLGDEGGADLAVLLALASLATDRPVRPDVVAAGALSLRGSVRPVAGLPEKVLAAARAGARKVLVPATDFAGLQAALPPAALASIAIAPVAHADEAVREALIDIVIARDLI